MSAGHLRSAQDRPIWLYGSLEALEPIGPVGHFGTKFPEKTASSERSGQKPAGAASTQPGQWTLTLDDKSLMSRSNSWRRSSRGRKGVTSVTGTRPVSCSQTPHFNLTPKWPAPPHGQT
jgi:hypothetical protein